VNQTVSYLVVSALRRSPANLWADLKNFAAAPTEQTKWTHDAARGRNAAACRAIIC